MSHEAEELLPAEVEAFSLTADILHMCVLFHVHTLSRIPTGIELQVRDAWVTEVQAVATLPSDNEKWVDMFPF